MQVTSKYIWRRIEVFQRGSNSNYYLDLPILTVLAPKECERTFLHQMFHQLKDFNLVDRPVLIKNGIQEIETDENKGLICRTLEELRSKMKNVIERSFSYCYVNQKPFEETLVDTNVDLRLASMFKAMHRYTFLTTENEKYIIKNFELDNVADFWKVERFKEKSQAAWDFDANKKMFKFTNNSMGLQAIIFNEMFNEYDFSVKVSVHDAPIKDGSLANPDISKNCLGVVIAQCTDDDGKINSLTAVRSTGEIGKTWAIYHNFQQDDEELILDGTRHVKWGNGVFGMNATSTAWTPEFSWNTWPEGTRIRVVKHKEKLTLYTTQLDSPTVFDEDSKLELDLNSSLLLQKYWKLLNIGFFSSNIPNVKFEEFDLISGKNIKYNIFDKKFYIWNFRSEIWNYSENLPKFFENKTIVKNDLTGTLFRVEDDMLYFFKDSYISFDSNLSRRMML